MFEFYYLEKKEERILIASVSDWAGCVFYPLYYRGVDIYDIYSLEKVLENNPDLVLVDSVANEVSINKLKGIKKWKNAKIISLS